MIPLRYRFALCLLKKWLERQIKEPFDPALSRKIDLVIALLEDRHD